MIVLSVGGESACQYTRSPRNLDDTTEHADGYLLPMLYMQRGELYDSLDNHDMAIGDYGRAIDLSPERPDIYLWRGSLYLLKKNYTNAIEDLNKVVEMAPELKTRILPLRAKVHRLKGELQLALQDIDLSLELDRKNEMAIFERIMILFETKDYEEARKACLEFLDLYPEDETIYSILAQISGKQGMHGEAEAYFYKASELSEDTPEFLYRLVEVIHEYYDYVDVAINLLKKYIALRPNDSKGYNALGFYYIVDGNLKEAQLVLEKSLDIETSSIGLINLSVVKWLMNDIGQAQKSLREALKISGKTHYRKKGNIRRPSVFIEGWINIMLGNKTNGLMIMNETIQKESIWFLHNTEVWSKAVIEKGDSTPDGLTEALEMIQRMINQKKER